MVDTTATMVCEVHPKVETSLRCNKCGRAMCTKCAVSTPVGYRCKQCVKGQQKVYFNATSYDPLLQFGLAFILSALAVGVLSFFRFGFFFLIIIFFAGSAIGGGIADLAQRIVNKRRGRYAYLIVAAGIICGGLAVTAVGLFVPYIRVGLLELGLFSFAAVGGAVGRIRIGR